MFLKLQRRSVCVYPILSIYVAVPQRFEPLPCFGAITQLVIEAAALGRTGKTNQRKATQRHPNCQTEHGYRFLGSILLHYYSIGSEEIKLTYSSSISDIVLSCPLTAPYWTMLC